MKKALIILGGITAPIVIAELCGITVIRGAVWYLSFFIPGLAQISW